MTDDNKERDRNGNIRDWLDYGPATRAIRAGQHRSEYGEHSESIVVTSSFVFESAAQAAARFSGEEEGYIYARFSNPTVDTFTERLAALEGGESCIGTSSGMAAYTLLCLGVLGVGDHVVLSRNMFGTTLILFKNILSRFGIEYTFVDLIDLDSWQSALQSNTRLVLFETPANPLTEVGDVAAISVLVKSFNQDILVGVDNCFCTPALQTPLTMGADLVVHSATKYLDGQGRAVGGAVVGTNELVEGKLLPIMRGAGLSMSPFNAWIFLKGLETLQLRMDKISSNALAIAKHLDSLAGESKVGIEKVFYPGLPSHPQYELSASQQSASGGVISFTLSGGREAAWKLMDAARLVSITANLGDTKTTITHPATTTHGRLSEEERDASGISEGLIRLAVGLEDPEDIIDDIQLG
ncbi:MAG: O-succinylhomoserine sulfhydrylase [Arenicellaceae bacterium]|nr:O-succinylhomoserine sulfhydrylase [Arenicellaceae bacterium]